MRCQQGVNNITLHLTAASGTIQAEGQSGPSISVGIGLTESQAAVVQVPDYHISADEWNAPVTNFTLTNVGVQTVADIYHCNSVDVVPATNNVLLSVRHTSGVYLINKSSGMVSWKMGGKTTTPDGGSAQCLVATGDPQTAFSLQHDARFQSSSVVSLFDNHWGSQAMPVVSSTRSTRRQAR